MDTWSLSLAGVVLDNPAEKNFILQNGDPRSSGRHNAKTFKRCRAPPQQYARCVPGEVNSVTDGDSSSSSSSSSSSRTMTNEGGNDNSTMLDCSSLERSLKRVRLTSCRSPGELCMQRDLKHLLLSENGDNPWRIVRQGSKHGDGGGFGGEQEGACHDSADLFERVVISDGTSSTFLRLLHVPPTRLVLQVNDSVEVEIKVPRHYPHRPPEVSNIVYFGQDGNKKIRTIVISGEYAPEPLVEEEGVENLSRATKSTMAVSCFKEVNDTEVVLTNWSPVRRLSQVLDDIVAILMSDRGDRSNVTTDGNDPTSMAVSSATTTVAGEIIRESCSTQGEEGTATDAYPYSGADRASELPEEQLQRLPRTVPTMTVEATPGGRHDDVLLSWNSATPGSAAAALAAAGAYRTLSYSRGKEMIEDRCDNDRVDEAPFRSGRFDHGYDRCSPAFYGQYRSQHQRSRTNPAGTMLETPSAFMDCS